MSEQRALAKTQDPIYNMLAGYKKAIASVIPKHMTAERMMRIAYQMIYRTPRLRSCTPESLINGVMEISMLGLDLGRTAHLVPFGKEAVVIIDYKGFIDLAHRSGQINSFPCKAVYENDVFEYEEGTNRYIKHIPARENRGKLYAAYAIVNFKHGGYDFEVVLPADAEAAKAKSPAKNSKDSPWNKPDEVHHMWIKTGVRRISKRIPQSPELNRAVQLEDLVEAGLKQDIGRLETFEPLMIQDAEFEETKTEKDPKQAIKDKLDNMKGQTHRASPSESTKGDPGASGEGSEGKGDETIPIGQDFANLAGMMLSKFQKLRTTGLKEFVEQHEETFPGWPEEIQKIVKDKMAAKPEWAPLWDELQKVPEGNNKGGSGGLAGDPDLKIMVTCPEDSPTAGDEISLSYCKKVCRWPEKWEKCENLKTETRPE